MIVLQKGMIKANRYENLPTREYLNLIRPYLRNLINDHNPIMETNNSNRAEWKIQLVIKNNFLSVKDFEDTRAGY